MSIKLIYIKKKQNSQKKFWITLTILYLKSEKYMLMDYYKQVYVKAWSGYFCSVIHWPQMK